MGSLCLQLPTVGCSLRDIDLALATVGPSTSILWPTRIIIVALLEVIAVRMQALLTILILLAQLVALRCSAKRGAPLTAPMLQLSQRLRSSEQCGQTRRAYATGLGQIECRAARGIWLQPVRAAVQQCMSKLLWCSPLCDSRGPDRRARIGALRARGRADGA